MSSEFLNFSPENVYGRLEAEVPSSAPNATFMGGCKIGAFSYVGKNTTVSRSTIGRYCSIAQNIHIGLFNHRMTGLSTHAFSYGSSGVFRGVREMAMIANRRSQRSDGDEPVQSVLGVTVGNDVWIGGSVLIRHGVKIGDGAVVAAGAVVVKDVKPYEIVGGVAAKTIRMRFPTEIIERLLALEWWNYDLSHPAIAKIDKSDIVRCIDPLEKALLSGEVRKAKFRLRRVPNRRSLVTSEVAVTQSPSADPSLETKAPEKVPNILRFFGRK